MIKLALKVTGHEINTHLLTVWQNYGIKFEIVAGDLGEVISRTDKVKYKINSHTLTEDTGRFLREKKKKPEAINKNNLNKNGQREAMLSLPPVD